MLIVLRVRYAWLQRVERFDEVRKGKDKIGPYLEEAVREIVTRTLLGIGYSLFLFPTELLYY